MILCCIRRTSLHRFVLRLAAPDHPEHADARLHAFEAEKRIQLLRGRVCDQTHVRVRRVFVNMINEGLYYALPQAFTLVIRVHRDVGEQEEQAAIARQTTDCNRRLLRPRCSVVDHVLSLVSYETNERVGEGFGYSSHWGRRQPSVLAQVVICLWRGSALEDDVFVVAHDVD